MRKSTYGSARERTVSLADVAAAARPAVRAVVGRAMREVLPFTTVERVEVLRGRDDGRDIVLMDIICRCATRRTELVLEQPGDMEGMVESQMSVALVELLEAVVRVRGVWVTQDGPEALRCAGSFLIIG